jgi:hypothetical protein
MRQRVTISPAIRKSGRPRIDNAGKKVMRLYLTEDIFKKVLILSIDKGISKESIIEKGLSAFTK